ncbi:hypothetical protein GCM10028803_43930 [Larkinella knui]|uniref:DUF5683 domain-containing protein n=1 Tax=Larkinella knui TaxID=2025310 RepID=A0A3P1CP33_9BACT|nr:hypothetical protein [Larkinella knui]RRB15009.1 hypothetical protein EHT87_10650 [Larkinella knui]
MHQQFVPLWLKRLVFFLLVLCALPAVSQVAVTNVRLNVINESAVEILYDITGNQPADSVYIRIRSQTNGLLNPAPQHISGDWGQDVQPGPNRRIVWRALENGFELDENIRATILVKVAPATARKSTGPVPAVSADTVKRKYRPGGPEFALLSLVAPGVGNIFVQSPKPVIAHRLGITVACYGLMAYGLVERKKSRDDYSLYEQQRNRTAAQPYYDRANQHHHRYYLATRLSGAIWITDIVATFIKGVRNQKERSKTAEPKISLRPGYQSGSPVAVFHYNF